MAGQAALELVALGWVGLISLKSRFSDGRARTGGRSYIPEERGYFVVHRQFSVSRSRSRRVLFLFVYSRKDRPEQLSHALTLAQSSHQVWELAAAAGRKAVPYFTINIGWCRQFQPTAAIFFFQWITIKLNARTHSSLGEQTWSFFTPRFYIKMDDSNWISPENVSLTFFSPP